MSRDTRYTYQLRIRCDVTRLNLPGHMIAVGTPAIRHIHVKKKTDISPVCSKTDRERERDDDDYDDKEERSEQLKRFSGTSM